jgi:hypothetical protein
MYNKYSRLMEIYCQQGVAGRDVTFEEAAHRHRGTCGGAVWISSRATGGAADRGTVVRTP